ncbi:MAG TPA: AsmA-like C-terminal region-containing protein [Burkholderiales bacterium]|nr:AsmA-like C-terminal region-containing protein [Burkholderiales bacterium]
MKSRNRWYFGAGIAVALLLVVPFLLPLGRLIPELERIASEQLKAPVRIESLRLFLLPLPHLSIDGITVGKQPFLQVQNVRVIPSLTSLFSEQKVIRKISLRGVLMNQRLIAKASTWAGRPASGGPAPVRVERIEVRDANIDFTDFKLSHADVILELTPEGGLAQAQVHADQGRLVGTLVPQGKEFALKVSAQDWKLPAGPPILLSSLAASGILNADGLVLSTIDSRLYDGTLAGTLTVGWKKDWTVAGNFDVRQVEIGPLVALFSKETTISGRLLANPVIDMRAPSAAQLAEAISVESDFKVENGVLYKVDLAAAPKVLFNKDAMKGGDTRFQEFSGHLSVDPAGYHLTGLNISSGLFKAQGELSISPKQELAGRIDVEVKGTSNLVSTPLAVSGTVQNPTLFPTKAAMAGAAAGTALLGPGVGTTIGMKAGQFTERLFRKKPPKKTDSGTPPPARVDASRTGPEKEGTQAESASPGSKPAESAGRR